jgi:hypothetical protein
LLVTCLAFVQSLGKCCQSRCLWHTRARKMEISTFTRIPGPKRGCRMRADLCPTSSS